MSGQGDRCVKESEAICVLRLERLVAKGGRIIIPKQYAGKVVTVYVGVF